MPSTSSTTGVPAAGARVCSCGCGRPLKKKDGKPDWSRRRFATKDCLATDKRNRVTSKRAAQSAKPVTALVVDGGDPRPVTTLTEAAALLRELGHQVSIIRPRRARKAKAGA